MPLDEFAHWCAFYNLESYAESLSEDDTSPKAFFDAHLMKTGANKK